VSLSLFLPDTELPDDGKTNKYLSLYLSIWKNVTFMAKVDSSDLLRKPNMKWLKGKWLDLGSKAGKHVQFKETYDRNSKVYTYEMSIIKVVEGDAGGYRCEVTSKDKCDSCTFEVTVEGGSLPDAGEDAGDLDFSALLKKREKKARDEPKEEVDVWEILKDAKPCDYEKIAFDYGITDLRGLLKRLKKMKKVEPKKSDAFLKKLEQCYSVDKGKRTQMHVELHDPNVQVKWLKNGVEIKPSAKYVFECVGNKRTLTINKSNLSDDAAYECVVGEEKSFTEVFVKEPPVTITKLLDDVHVVVGEKVEFECEVSEEGANVRWMKDGVELTKDGKYRIKKDGKKHTLVINEATIEDIGMYYVYTNGGESKGELEVGVAIVTYHPLTLPIYYSVFNTVIITQDHLSLSDIPPPLTDPPKIHLDTSSTGSKNTIVVVAGNKLRLDVEITGEPVPTVCWMKGDTGRVRVETRTTLSSFVIEGAERPDEGQYSIIVTNPAGEDRAELTVKIVDVPNPPENVRCMGVGEDTATITWDPPKFDGGAPIKGYLMERKKQGSSRWTKLNFEVFESTTYEAKKMIEGVFYEMRVFAVNGIGISQPSGNSKPFMPIAPTSEPTRLTVEDVTDSTCALKWRPPERVGAGGVDGYIIEWCKEGEDNWVAANKEPVDKNTYRVKGLPTGEKLLFRVVAMNIAGRSPPCTMKQSVTVREIMEYPKIRLPRQLRTKFIRKVGEKINLVIPFQGKPRPVVNWLKDGEPLENKSVGIRTSDFDTILFIRSAERDHSGTYTLSVQIDNMQDKADIHIQIVDKPGPPINVMVTDVWGFNAALEWKPPKDTGNTDITGYTIQKADKKTQGWFTVYEHNRRPSCTASDLVMGNEYSFRVFSENICGLSDEVAFSKNTAIIGKTEPLHYTTPHYTTPYYTIPNFTAPLVDRVVVAGYSTAISCAVRAYPKVRNMHLLVTYTFKKKSMEVDQKTSHICLMQCDTSPSHRVDQAVDCGLWNVVPLLFNGCVKLLVIVGNWNTLSYTSIQSIPMCDMSGEYAGNRITSRNCVQFLATWGCALSC
uniref:Myosin binding protein Ca n=1 Tax=Hucho hucho TaxID=62062 RepID=A0A4W5QXN9_9TELE